MPLILYECASLRFRHRPPNWIPMIRVTFKFISALKQWLACTIFFAIIPLHVRTHSSKSYLLIFLHVFILTFLITLLTNTPRMKNQFSQLIHLSLHSTLMIRLTFLKYFISFFLYFFYATPKFLPQGRRHATYKRAAGRERPATRKKGPRPYMTRNPPASAGASSWSRLSWAVQAGNSRSHCRRLKLVNWLYPAKYAFICSISTSPDSRNNLISHCIP